jgi:hypothetical protein
MLKFMEMKNKSATLMCRVYDRQEGWRETKVAHFVKTEKSAQLRATFLLFRYYSFCLCPAVPV